MYLTFQILPQQEQHKMYQLSVLGLLAVLVSCDNNAYQNVSFVRLKDPNPKPSVQASNRSDRAAFSLTNEHLASLQSLFYQSLKKGTYQGLLTPECTKQYYRTLVTREVPPRSYLYTHEAAKDSQEQISFRIVGGQQVNIEDVPYSVLYGLYCGGALIAPEWVLTAAHCKAKEKFVYAGSTLRSKTTRYTICAHFIHPQWDVELHNHDYDYQLVLLETAVPVTPKSRPIAIGALNLVRTGELVTVSGWGHIRQKKGEKMQDHLRKVAVPIMDWDACKSLPAGDYKRVTQRMFCAGFKNGTKDSCQGDSGGPAVLRGYLIGIVSFGVGCAEPNQPGVYSIVPKARDWIRYITALPL